MLKLKHIGSDHTLTVPMTVKNKTKNQNKQKQNKIKQDKTKQSKTKQNTFA